MLIFKALHILSMFSVVTMEIGAEFLYAFAVSRRDVRALATVHRTLEQARLGPISIAVFISGVVFGLLTSLTGGFDFLAGWLIAAYVLVAVIFVSGSRLWPKILLPLGAKAVEAEAGQRPIDDVVRDMAASRAARWFVAMATIFVLIILDMVLKPF
jgi:xanthine/uracil permease